MSAPAVAVPGGREIVIGGRAYPVVLPKLSDPRLHLAAVIVSLQVLGQVAFDFRLSIAQILIALGTCAVLEVAITFGREHVLMWPASALLTGNGVAFVLRVAGTHHGDWWDLRGWWIFAATAAVSLLSKYVIRLGGGHVFNPSNFGLVLCFLVLGSGRVEPLDFWWGPMSGWMVAALAIIVGGGLAILFRLRLLSIALGFWLSFAAATALLAAMGHAMAARWHLGPLTGLHFWWVLVTSPEVLVFLFFMITDPKTSPRAWKPRVAYAVAIGLLAALLIAPAKTEFWSKVAVLGSLAIVCLVRALWRRFGRPWEVHPRWIAFLAVAGIAVYAGTMKAVGARAENAQFLHGPRYLGPLPTIEIVRSKGILTLDRKTAERITRDLLADLGPVEREEVVSVQVVLEPGQGQGEASPAVRADEGGGHVAAFSMILKHGAYRIFERRKHPRAPL